jgi:hypothetical protein
MSGLDEQYTESERAQARKRIKDRRGFGWHLATYVIINVFLVLIWWFSGGGGFWPIWTMVPWGIGLAFHFVATFLDRPITEGDVERELRRHGRRA